MKEYYIMIKPTLVILAAGMGSRYGGLKQIEPVGPSGEVIIDYSIYDALKAGFEKVVFIIREEMKEGFQKNVGKRIESLIDTSYVFQSIHNIPKGSTAPVGRIKQWGTAHAVMCCKDVVKTPFLVINADDFYGATSFKLIYEALLSIKDENIFYQYSMLGFNLENTLTEHGQVARGICKVDNLGYLIGIEERTKIQRFDTETKYTEDGEEWIKIPKGSVVSMNAWGFTTSIFSEIEAGFSLFLEQNKEDILKAEYFIPCVIDKLIAENKAKVKVIASEEQWYGVTYKEDKPNVKKAINALIEKGNYPKKLYNNQ
jgi:choline kinase